MLTSMGFDRDASITALKKTNGNVDAAVDAILSGGGGEWRFFVPI